MRGYVSLHQKEDTSGCTREASRESRDEKSQPPGHLRRGLQLGADSGDQTYSNLVAAGIVDAWSTTNPGDPGYTCCLVNGNPSSASTLTIRIDLVLLLNKARALDMEIVGNEPADLTPSGLWPSDHAGVVATVRI